MNTNLTKVEILEAVDNIFNHFNITQNYDIVKAIAKEYVRRGEQRDKLLEEMREVERIICLATDPRYVFPYAMERFRIAREECEDK